MKLSIRLIIALALTLLVSAPLRAADSVEIKQRWQAGKRYYQTTITEQESKIDFGEEKMDQSSNMTVEITLTVKPRVAGEPKRMTIRYERTAVEISMNGQKMGFDSADPKASTDPLDLAKAAGATIGKELKIVLNDKDEVVEVENYSEFIKNLAPAGDLGFDPAQMFSKEALTQTLRQGGLSATPEKPVAIGDTWAFSTMIDQAQIGKVAMAGTYTLKGLGQHDGTNCAEITTDGTVAMELGGAAGVSPEDAQSMKVTGGTTKGSIWFDSKLGCARDTQLVQEMTISMKNPLDESKMISMPMKQTISVKLTKVEDVK